MELTQAHLEAVDRCRRIALNFDVSFAVRVRLRERPDEPVEELVEHLFGFTDSADVVTDSIWWNWSEGNQVPYASEFLPIFDDPTFKCWVDQGVDIVRLVLEATRRRGVESFYAHRMNGSDNDLGPFAELPMKVEHPDWMFRTPWCTHENNGYWNFSLPQVRDYVVRNLREIAENYDFDGFDLDFARGCVFPSGQAWNNRNALTEFIQRVRETLLETAAAQGRPVLLSVRIPETVVGCHFDGIDVETWIRDGLIDILALGVRSFEVDIGAFRQLTAGTHVKLLPSLDDHHATDGYQNPGIQVLRGVAANWWRQGADGIQTFNWNYSEDFPFGGQDWQSHLQAYREFGDPQLLERKDKTFVVGRRGGGHGPTVIPNPEDWSTPRHWYANSNMLAQLPAPLANDDNVDTLLKLSVADPVAAGDGVTTALRLLLSDADAETVPSDLRLEPVMTATIGHPKPGLMNTPAAKQIASAIRIRINNIPLPPASIEGGWLVFTVDPDQLAVGENLVGLSVSGRDSDAARILVEKLEIEIRYLH